MCAFTIINDDDDDRSPNSGENSSTNQPTPNLLVSGDDAPQSTSNTRGKSRLCDDPNHAAMSRTHRIEVADEQENAVNKREREENSVSDRNREKLRPRKCTTPQIAAVGADHGEKSSALFGTD